MPSAHRLARLSASVALMAAWGCGDAPAVSTARTEATVKGTVTIKGRPASSGTIVFDPSNSERRDAGPISSPIGKDGGYSIKTLVGSNRVTVSGKELLKQAPEIQHERLNYEVRGGENTYDIELPSRK